MSRPTALADSSTGFLSMMGPLPASIGTVNSLFVTIDRQSWTVVPVTGGSVRWTSGPLTLGAHAVSVRRGVRETLSRWDNVVVSAGQVTPLPIQTLSAPTGLLVVDLEFRGLSKYRLGRTFDVSINGNTVSEKGKLVSSDRSDDVQVQTYHFEIRFSPGVHQLSATLCDADGFCSTKLFPRVRIVSDKTTRVVHRWRGMSVLSSHGGVRDFDSRCDCDGIQWEPALR